MLSKLDRAETGAAQCSLSHGQKDLISRGRPAPQATAQFLLSKSKGKAVLSQHGAGLVRRVASHTAVMAQKQNKCLYQPTEVHLNLEGSS